MKTTYISLLLLLLTSCSGGYYSHIPRTKTTVNHHTIQPIKELKDTVFYKLLPPVIADTLFNIEPKSIVISKITFPVKDTSNQAIDTVKQVINYDDHVKDVYNKGKKLFYKYAWYSLLQAVIGLFSETIGWQILTSIPSVISVYGFLLIFISIYLHLFRKRYSKKLTNPSYSDKVEKQFTRYLIVASFSLLIMVASIFASGPLLTVGTAQIITVASGIIGGVYAFAFAFRAYMRKKLKSTTISDKVPANPDKKPKNPRKELLVTGFKFSATATAFWTPYLMATSEAEGVTILLSAGMMFGVWAALWLLGVFMFIGILFFKRQKKRKQANG